MLVQVLAIFLTSCLVQLITQQLSMERTYYHVESPEPSSPRIEPE